MRKLKLTLFIGSIVGTLGALGYAIYNIEKNKENSSDLKVKGVFDVEYLKLFDNYDDKKDAGVTKENIYFNYEVPFENKSIKKNENKIFNIGTQSELLLSLALFKLLEETKNEVVENKRISLDDRINKWFSISNGSDEDKKVAKILNGDLLKRNNFVEQNQSFNYLTNTKIYNLLLHASTLPNFNNLKTDIKNDDNEDITKDIKMQYYKNPITSFNNTDFTERTKWKLLDFFNLSASNWIDKVNNNLTDNPSIDYFNTTRNQPLRNEKGPWKRSEVNEFTYNYSPLNFILLANIMEKVYKNFYGVTNEKATFDKIINEYVLKPLKMNNTFYNIEKIDKLKNKVYKDYDTTFLNASKGYVSTLEDLSKLYKALFKKDSKLLNSERFNEFFKFVNPEETFKNKLKTFWPGIAGLKIFERTSNGIIDLSSDYKEQFFFIKGISPDFRSFSFYCKEKEIIFTAASDVPYSSYSTSIKKDKFKKNPTELTILINSTFEFDISTLIEKKS